MASYSPDMRDIAPLEVEAPPYEGRGRVLRIKEGYNPNSSSLGSVVFSIHTAVLAAPALLAAVTAGLAWHMTRAKQNAVTEPGTGDEPPQEENCQDDNPQEENRDE